MSKINHIQIEFDNYNGYNVINNCLSDTLKLYNVKIAYVITCESMDISTRCGINRYDVCNTDERYVIYIESERSPLRDIKYDNHYIDKIMILKGTYIDELQCCYIKDFIMDYFVKVGRINFIENLILKNTETIKFFTQTAINLDYLRKIPKPNQIVLHTKYDNNEESKQIEIYQNIIGQYNLTCYGASASSGISIFNIQQCSKM